MALDLDKVENRRSVNDKTVSSRGKLWGQRRSGIAEWGFGPWYNAPTVGLETTTENALFSTFAASAIPSLPITFVGRTGTQTQPQN
jgi:hypothetical protein